MKTFLTLERARLYALLTLVLGCYGWVSAVWMSPQRLRIAADFPAFYNAGRLINEYPRGSLYNQQLQRDLYSEIAPSVPHNVNLFFAYAPFLALVFAPFASISYLPAFVCWVLVSLALFTLGFQLVWRVASLPDEYRISGFLIAVSFLPFYAWCLGTGQTSAFGFFWLALAIYLDRSDRPLESGLALAMLLYKPPLLVLLIPMIIVTKRWRSLLGVCVGAIVLSLMSLALIGTAGLAGYVEMLAHFSSLKASGTHWTWHETDAFSLFLLITHQRNLAYLLLALLVLAISPFLISTWRRRPDVSWIPTITWSLVLNVYVLIYDVTLIILSAVLLVGTIFHAKHEIPPSIRWILAIVFSVPWLETYAAQFYGFQPLTLVIIGFGCYQLRFLLRTPVNDGLSVQRP